MRTIPPSDQQEQRSDRIRCGEEHAWCADQRRWKPLSKKPLRIEKKNNVSIWDMFNYVTSKRTLGISGVFLKDNNVSSLLSAGPFVARRTDQNS
jgi:hypothetical protein